MLALGGHEVSAQDDDDVRIALDVHRWLTLDDTAIDDFGDLRSLYGVIGNIVNDCFGDCATHISGRIKGKSNSVELRLSRIDE